MHNIGNRFEAGACRSADQRGLMRQIEGIGVKSERGIANHRSHVIRAASLQCHGYQALRAFLLIGDRAEHFFDSRILQHAAQAVRAQEPTVGRMRFADGDIRVGVDVKIAEHTHHDVALRMIARLGWTDAAGINQMLYVAVIGGHTRQFPVTKQIRAGIADMRQHPVPGNQSDCDHRRAHAGEFAFMFRFADNRIMRSHHGGFHHLRHSFHTALLVILFNMSKRTNGDGGRGIAAGMTSHAVAHGDQAFPGEGGILVIAANRTDIGNGGRIKEQRLLGCIRHQASPQLERRGADTDRDTSGQHRRSADTALIDHRTVRGAKILNHPRAGCGIKIDTGVMRGDEFVIKHDGIGRRTAEGNRCVSQRNGTSGERAVDDDQQGRLGGLTRRWRG